MAMLRLAHDYSISAGDLFARIMRWDELVEVMQGVAAFEGLPPGELQAGQRFTVNIALRGAPPAPWSIEVVRRDDAARVVQTIEHGGPIRRWAHTIEIEDRPEGGAVMRDTLEIDAGDLTDAHVERARAMYEARHAARRKLLGL